MNSLKEKPENGGEGGIHKTQKLAKISQYEVRVLRVSIPRPPTPRCPTLL